MTTGTAADEHAGSRALRPAAPAGAGPLTWRGRTALGLLFVVLALLLMELTPARLGHDLPSNLGDPALVAWLMDWGAHAAVHDPTGYFDAPIFAPTPGTTAYTESLLPLALVFGPVHALAGSASWALALNVTLVLLVAANLAASFALTRWLTGRTDAALVAALGFSFSSYFLGRIGNSQLLASFFVPLGLLLLLRVLTRPRVVEGVALGLVTIGQVLSVAYYGILWVLVALVVGVGWLLVRRRLSWALVRALAAGAVVAGAVLVPLTRPYLALQSDPAFDRPVESRGGLEVRDLLTPPPGSHLWSRLVEAFPPRNEHVVFPGLLVTLLALAGVAVVLSRRGRAEPGAPGPGSTADRRLGLWLVLVAGAVSLVLASGPTIAGRPAPFAFFFDHVPGWSGVRVPARLVVVALLAAAVLAGVGYGALTRRLSRPARAGACAAACLVVLAEMWTALPFAPLPTDGRTLAVYRALEDRGPGAVVELPMPVPGLEPQYPYVEAPRQLYASLDWHPRVNGYSGYLPPTYLADAQLFASFPAQPVLARLRQLGVRWVVVHGGVQDGPGQYGPAARTRVLGALPGSAVVTPLGDDTLVELPR